MSDLDHALMLLELARCDLEALRGMIEPFEEPIASFADSIIGFHAQQAVEKSLKAWLAASGRRYPLTHNLFLLVELVGEAGGQVEDLTNLVELNPYAVQLRYSVSNEDLARDEPLDRRGLLGSVLALFIRIERELTGA